MKIKVIDEVKLHGKPSGLWNYQHVDGGGNPISAVFQATEAWLRANRASF